jgi:hypothetical protein
LGGATNALGVNGLDLQRLHIGTPGTVADFAAANQASVRYVGAAQIAARVVQAFTAPAGDSQEVLALQIPNGGTLGLLVPTVGTAQTVATDQLTGDVTDQLKQAGDAHVIQRSRPIVAKFVTGVLTSARASALVAKDAPPGTQQLAKLLDAKGATVADLATGSATTALTRAGANSSDATLAAGADDLVDRAELAVGAVTNATVKTVGRSPDGATFKDAAKQAALTKALADALPGLSAGAVTHAAKLASP